MKIWIKYLVAAVVGAAAGLLLPSGVAGFVNSLADIALNAARYAVMPLVFFSAAVAAFELHEERSLLKVWAGTSGWSLASVALFTLLGLAGGLLFPPGRIPLPTDSASNVGSLPGAFQLLEALIPPNSLSTLLNAEFIAPAAIFAIVLGVAFSFDKAATKPALGLFDSLSRIAWQVNSFVVEVLPLPLIAIAMARSATIAGTEHLSVYGRLLATLGGETIVAVGAVVPLALFLLDRKKNPFATLFAISAPAIAALVTGNALVQAGAAAKHLKESLGVRRRAGAVSLPFALAMGRAGSAMVAATSFITILDSYSNLGLGSSTVLWMIAAVPMAALALGAMPGAGPIVALATLCGSYGRGFESGYMVLLPAALPLALIAAFVDAVVMSAVTIIAASRNGYRTPKELRHFI